ncbi:Phosphoheptose isomerase [anaerobic digester metagenome]|uniref:D-sedoheptulose-7-phosphate isomerase n=1 Tax=Petrimonas sp. TaxID=2023866 RepID=UPI0030D314E5
MIFFNNHTKIKNLDFIITRAAQMMIKTYLNGGKVLVCGNGGSCSDADHIVAELMKNFEKQRPLREDLQDRLKMLSSERGKLLAENLQQGLPTVSLTVHNALITAISNDISADMIFAQQVVGLGEKGDVLIGLSTSGNAKNVIDAFIVAKAKGLKTIGMTGESGGKLKEFCDVLINVPETRTAYVQELHLSVYHAICMRIEDEIFRKK